MAENLRVTHYCNGAPIPRVDDHSDWDNCLTGACCVYDNDDSYINTYGYLYNWYAVDDERNIAPEGWHVPTDEEWKQLEISVGMDSLETIYHLWRGTDQGSKLAGNASLWNDGLLKNLVVFGSSGFCALPAGKRNEDGAFHSLGNSALFWTSSFYSQYAGWYHGLDADHIGVGRWDDWAMTGVSLRCVRD